mgnify:CR=1 FL=1
MKIKTLLTTLTLGVALASCQRNSLSIHGQIDNTPDGIIYLSALDSNFVPQRIDSTLIKRGAFDFAKRQSTEPECFVLNFGQQNIVFFAGNDNVSITGNALKPEEIDVQGSETNEILDNYIKNMPGRERLYQLQTELQQTSLDDDRREELLQEAKVINDEQTVYIKQYIAENNNNTVGPFILLNNLNNFSFDENEQLIEQFEQNISENKYVKLLNKILENSRAKNEARKSVEINQPAPDFTLTDINGKEVTLSDLRGKIVMLDFWASWCKPCRENNKTITEVYKKFGSKGCVIVGVSVDQDEAAWRKAVSNDKLPGYQLRDTRGIADKYCIKYIPFCYIIDENGTIVQKNITEEKLFKEIESLIK